MQGDTVCFGAPNPPRPHGIMNCVHLETRDTSTLPGGFAPFEPAGAPPTMVRMRRSGRSQARMGDPRWFRRVGCHNKVTPHVEETPLVQSVNTLAQEPSNPLSPPHPRLFARHPGRTQPCVLQGDDRAEHRAGYRPPHRRTPSLVSRRNGAGMAVVQR